MATKRKRGQARLFLLEVPDDQIGRVYRRRVTLFFESISNQGLRGHLLNLRLLFSLHSRIPTNEGLPELVIEYLRPHLQ
jgi:hypothetical protein